MSLWESTGIYAITDFRQIIMLLLGGLLLYLGIVKKFEPLLLVGIAFGMILTNLPLSGVFTPELWTDGTDYGEVFRSGGLLDILYIGVKTGLYPSLIFLGVGAMTDFSALLADPRSMLLGAAAQLGVYGALFLAALLGFGAKAAAAIAIIGGADGPTAIWLTKILAPEYLGLIVIAAYSYMALIPLIQPPIMRLLTTKKERGIMMEAKREVPRSTRIIFPVAVTVITCLLLPGVTPLLGSLMLGNLLRECGVTERLSATVQNGLMNTVTVFLAVSVGATTVYYNFLTVRTLEIILLGLAAFAFSTAGGVLLGKLMCALTGGKINPLIGAAGVSAVPMAARVAQREGQRENPENFLLMHAMGPNVAGVIGSAVAAGYLLRVFG